MDQTNDEEKETREPINLRDKQLIKETRWLLSLEPDERTEYVQDIINSISRSLAAISSSEGGLKDKLKMVNDFMIELDEKSPELIPPITYAVKPEFQDAFSGFLRSLASNT